MRALIVSGLLVVMPAACRPIVTNPDPDRCIVWVTDGSPTGNVEPPCTINVVGMTAAECDHAGGRPTWWGCEDLDF